MSVCVFAERYSSVNEAVQVGKSLAAGGLQKGITFSSVRSLHKRD